MRELLAEFWWVLVLRGVSAIAFGVLAVLWPGITIEVLLIFFGAYMLVDGVFGVVGAIRGRHHAAHWMLMLLEGLLGIAVGLLTWIAPVITGFALLMYVAAWAILTGVLEVVSAIRLRKEIQGEFWLALAGVLSIGFGVLLVVFPLAGAFALLWVLAGYAIAFGIVLILLGFRVRGSGRTGLEQPKAPPAPA
jgi:uncharacterized membrane protein HdeD (DUF308 family)